MFFFKVFFLVYLYWLLEYNGLGIRKVSLGVLSAFCFDCPKKSFHILVSQECE